MFDNKTSLIGFDRFDSMLDRLFDVVNPADIRRPTYPPYNMIKDKNNYRIEIAVAGFSQEDLSVVQQDNSLVIKGDKKQPIDDNQQYLYRGLATRQFEHKFMLTDSVVVNDINLQDGILTITMEDRIPPEKQPRILPINGESTKRLEKRIK